MSTTSSTVRQSKLRLLANINGGVSILLGATTIVAWYLHLSNYLRWTTQSSPLHFNSALVFLFVGITHFCLDRSHRKTLGTILALAVAAIATYTLMEYIVSPYFLIDEVFIVDHLTPRALAPGRISPNSSVCSILIAVALLVRLHMNPSAMRSVALEVIGSLVFAFGMAALLGYVSGIAAAYSWGNLTHMPLQSALGFAVIGKVTTLSGWLSDPRASTHGPASLSVPALLSVLAFSLALSQALVVESQSNKLRGIAALADDISDATEYWAGRIDARLKALGRFGLKRPDVVASFPEFMAENNPEILGLWAFDNHDGLRQIYHISGDPDADRHDSELFNAAISALLLNHPNATNKERTSQPFRDHHGRWNILYLFTLPESSDFKDVQMIANLDMSYFFATVMKRFLPVGFFATVSFNGQDIFVSGKDDDNKPSQSVEWKQFPDETIQFLSIAGKVHIAPSVQWSVSRNSYLPAITLLAGILITLLIGSISHFALTTQTRRQEAEESNKKLLDEIERRRAVENELRAAKDVADHASQSKTFFLANASHELRTPLGIIIGYANLLRDDTLSPEAHFEFSDRILTNGVGLTRIIDDLLDLTKVEAGHLQFQSERFSLREFFVDLMAGFNLKAKQKEIGLKFIQDRSLPEEIATDISRLRQVLTNIIGNAIKFTDVGSVTVTIGSTPPVDGSAQLQVLVQDSGIGMTDSDRQLIFQPFSQGQQDERKRMAGTGLGLALSRQLARHMGGDISLVQTAPGLGSLFKITIGYTIVAKTPWSEDLLQRERSMPRLISPAPMITIDAPVVGEAPSLEGLQVLFVEDNTDNQYLVQRALSAAGANVTLANDGEQGVEKALAQSFDIVLMDLQMPVMDGKSACQFLRKRQYLKPIIAITAHAMREERERCLALGFSEYVTKPVRVDRLIATIKHTLA